MPIDPKNPFYSGFEKLALLWDSAVADELDRLEAGMMAPSASCTDPLAWLGSMEPLGLDDAELREARESARGLIESHSREWVWQNRTRLKLEIRWVLRF